MDANLIAGLVALVGILAIVWLGGGAGGAAAPPPLPLGTQFCHGPAWRCVGPDARSGRPSLPRQVSVTGLEAG